MFEPQDHPRLFALPPGVDFPAELMRGLLARHGDRAPEQLAQVEVFVNAPAMRHRLIEWCLQRRIRLLPRIRAVTDLAGDTFLPGVPPPVSPLRRRLELAGLIARLIERDPTLAPADSVFDLADSLGALMDEMQSEGVAPEVLDTLDISDESGHWARALQFIRIVRPYFSAETTPDGEARQRLAIDATLARWQANPPQHPILIAGSTGSRGATARLIEGVARLPQGAIVLPGFDFEQPADVWARLDDAASGEDHPQFRFARLMQVLDLSPKQIARWTDNDPQKARNKLVSLVLRPAPVTDQWMLEGPRLDDLPGTTKDMTLIEARSPRHEALAIALRLRKAAEDGQTAALITPDRMLTRQVAAALDRWALIPDDSAGRPLALSAPGRFLRHVAGLFGAPLTAEPLLTLLKHPICNTGSDERGPHLRLTRELELWLRRKGPPFLGADTIRHWAEGVVEASDWAEWLIATLDGLTEIGTTPLSALLERHIACAEALSEGPNGTTPGELWRKEAGEVAARVIAELRTEADAGGTLRPHDYRVLFQSVLDGADVREPVLSHPGIMIWGTREARVNHADLVILGGLNDGIWPQLPAPDPWLNRRMRLQAGLLLPERRVGLSAHDFQLAVAAPEVVLTRSLRNAEAETVVSRWLNRLTNLLGGLPTVGGPEALESMRKRGRHWLDMADAVERDYVTVPPEPRPSPRPPVASRPRKLSVTQIKTLIRDPYAIYARYVLKLRALDPLRQSPDAPLRGTVVHKIFELFIQACPDPGTSDARDMLLSIAQDVLNDEVPWPTPRHIWLARLERVADGFLADEVQRRAEASPMKLEGFGAMDLPGGFTLTGKADRIDLRQDGRLLIYDYKTGNPPSASEMKFFDKQLLLEAAMAEAGTFRDVPAATVTTVAHIALNGKKAFTPLPLRDHDADPVLDPDQTVLELRRLLDAYGQRSRGYTSRRAMHKVWNDGGYDHLARFGEWDDSDDTAPQDVGPEDAP